MRSNDYGTDPSYRLTASPPDVRKGFALPARDFLVSGYAPTLMFEAQPLTIQEAAYRKGTAIPRIGRLSREWLSSAGVFMIARFPTARSCHHHHDSHQPPKHQCDFAVAEVVVNQ